MMACRAAMCSSSHSYCPSLLCPSLPLFFFGPLSLQIQSLTVTPFSLCHLTLCFFLLHSSFSISISFSLPAPPSQPHLSSFFSHSSIPPSFHDCLTHCPSLIFQSFVCSFYPTLSVSSVTSGQATLRSPLPQHVGKSGGKARDLCINQVDPAPSSSTRQKEGKREQAEVKHSGRTQTVAMEQDEIYTVGALFYFPCLLVLIEKFPTKVMIFKVHEVNSMEQRIDNMLSQDIVYSILFLYRKYSKLCWFLLNRVAPFCVYKSQCSFFL